MQQQKEAGACMEEAVADGVRRQLSGRYAQPPLAWVHSYGCQQNVSDGEKLKGVLSALGYGFTGEPERADLILLNTCAVREGAESRVFGNVGALKHLKRRRPGLVIALCGCMTQQEQVRQRLKKSFPHVDLVFGANAAHRLPALLSEVLEGARVFDGADPEYGIVEGVPKRRDGAVKAWLPIMQGCDNFCTYCIVPYVRGREHSRLPADILREARGLLKQGYKEITLLGQNVNSYGKGLAGADFPGLLRALNALEGDFRIRFMTSHPKDCTAALIQAVADCEKVCGHIHLPVQSGSDRVLRAMNRHYTAAQYRSLIALARERIPGVSFTSDIMVGFPGEGREDFLQTLALVREVRFTSLFTFIYSPRSGTQAAEMDDPVPAQEKGRWFRELLAAQEQIGRAIYEQQVGKTLRVLVEGPGKGEGTLTGHTETGIIVQLPGPRELIGNFADVRITRALNWAIEGLPEG